MVHNERGPDGEGRGPGAWELIGLGMTNAVSLLGGAGLGWLVDSRLGTAPVFILLGLLSGIVLGATATYQQLRKYLND